jgi:hypothetical protein
VMCQQSELLGPGRNVLSACHRDVHQSSLDICFNVVSLSLISQQTTSSVGWATWQWLPVTPLDLTGGCYIEVADEILPSGVCQSPGLLTQLFLICLHKCSKLAVLQYKQ